ncbi:f-box family protein, partial [Genlisea aurea]
QLHSPTFPDEVLEKVIALIDSHKDRNSVSLVCRDWYNAERWTRSKLFIGNCYAVSPETVAKRFPRIKSVVLKGKPRFSDFNMLPPDWGANVHSWLVHFSVTYPFLEELRLKRMVINDESFRLLADSFPCFKSLSLLNCDGFSSDGLKAIARNCKNLTELDIQDCPMIDDDGDWIGEFPENFTSLQVLNFGRLNGDVNFDDLERLITRCRSLRVLKVNESISLDQIHRVLVNVPQLVELGIGASLQALLPGLYEELESTFNKCRNIKALSGLWDANSFYLPVFYGACFGLTFLNLTDSPLGPADFSKLLVQCPNLRRLWVLDTVEDKGLDAVGSSCASLEELRVLPYDPYDLDYGPGVTEAGFVAVSEGCPKLHYVLYFCRSMTNDAVKAVVRNCPDFTHFRLCIMNPSQPDRLTDEPMDEAFGAVVRTCRKLKRLSISGLLTDATFEYIGKYAKSLETLSVAFAGSSDRGMECVLEGCPKLRKLEIRDCPFGDGALLSGIGKYEGMRSLWMSSCRVTVGGCRRLARELPRLNVEVIEDGGGGGGDDDVLAEKIYVYRSVAGPRRDAPPFVITL